MESVQFFLSQKSLHPSISTILVFFAFLTGAGARADFLFRILHPYNLLLRLNNISQRKPRVGAGEIKKQAKKDRGSAAHAGH